MIQIPAGFDAAAFVADLFSFGVPVAGILALFLARRVIARALSSMGGR